MSGESSTLAETKTTPFSSRSGREREARRGWERVPRGFLGSQVHENDARNEVGLEGRSIGRRDWDVVTLWPDAVTCWPGAVLKAVRPCDRHVGK